MKSPRWTTVQESQFPWEESALNYLRERLPDGEPFRAWSNFEFVAEDGSINEVDLLVVSLHRVYLVEIKSRPGRLDGDAHTWRWSGDGPETLVDNPLLLANRKAKKLKDLLRRGKALQRLRIPYVEPVVFLSHPNVQVRLEGAARTGIFVRDETARDQPGIIALLTGEANRLSGSGLPADRIDRALSGAIARALSDAGLRPTQRHRQVGDYVLGALLDEIDVFQDWDAVHARFSSSRARIRIYPNARASSDTTREERRKAAEREFRLLDGIDHPGFLRVKSFTEHERGPALIFEQPENAQRLDIFLQSGIEGLGLPERLELLQRIAETLQYAHGRRLYHQALTPRSVLVTDPESPSRGVKLFNWQVGTGEQVSQSRTRLTAGHVLKFGLAGDAAGAVYLAPEL